jgi:hypothetical protein
MGTWIGPATIPWWYFPDGNPPPTFCEIGSEESWNHAWPMALHWTGYTWDDRDYNAGCWPYWNGSSGMDTLQCGQDGTSVFCSYNGWQINFVMTIEAGPCLGQLTGYEPPCGPPFYCGYDNPNLIGDITESAFQALGQSLSEGVFVGYVWQPS